MSQQNRSPREIWAQHQRGAFLTTAELARRTRMMRDTQTYEGFSSFQNQPAAASSSSQKVDPLDEVLYRQEGADALVRNNEFLLREQRRRENEAKQRLPPVRSPDGKFETYYGKNGQHVVRILPPTGNPIDEAYESLKYYFREYIFRNPMAWILILFFLMCLNWDTYVVSTFRRVVKNNLGRALRMLSLFVFWTLLCGVAYDLFTGMRLAKEIGNSYGIYQFWNQCKRYLVSMTETGRQRARDTYLEMYQKAEIYILNTVEKWAHSVINWVERKRGESMDPTTKLISQHETDDQIFYTPVGTPAPEQISLIDLELGEDQQTLTQMSNINCTMSPLTERQRLVKCFYNCGNDVIAYGSIVSENILAAVCAECTNKEMQGTSLLTTRTNTANIEPDNLSAAQQNNQISIEEGTSESSQDKDTVTETNPLVSQKCIRKPRVAESTISSKPRNPFDQSVVCRKIKKIRDLPAEQAPAPLDTPMATRSTQKPESSTRSTRKPESSTRSTRKPESSTRSTQKKPESATQKKPGSSTRSTQKKPESTRSTRKPESSTRSTQKPESSTRSIQKPESSTFPKLPFERLTEQNHEEISVHNEANAIMEKQKNPEAMSSTSERKPLFKTGGTVELYGTTGSAGDSSIITGYGNKRLKSNAYIHNITCTEQGSVTAVPNVVGYSAVDHITYPPATISVESGVTQTPPVIGYKDEKLKDNADPGDAAAADTANTDTICMGAIVVATVVADDNKVTTTGTTATSCMDTAAFTESDSPPSELILCSTKPTFPPIPLSEKIQTAITTDATVEDVAVLQATPPPTRIIKPIRKRLNEKSTIHCPLPGQANGVFGGVPKPFFAKPKASFQTVVNMEFERQTGEECTIEAVKDGEISTSETMVNTVSTRTCAEEVTSTSAAATNTFQLTTVGALPQEQMAGTSSTSTQLYIEETETDCGPTGNDPNSSVSHTPKITVDVPVAPGVAILSAAAGLPKGSNKSMKRDQEKPTAIPNSAQMGTVLNVKILEQADIQGNSGCLEHLSVTSNTVLEGGIATITDNTNTFYGAAFGANTKGYIIADSVMKMASNDLVMTNMNAHPEVSMALNEVTKRNVSSGMSIADSFENKMGINPIGEKTTTEQMTMTIPTGNTELRMGGKDEPLSLRVVCDTACHEGHMVPTPLEKGKGKAPIMEDMVVKSTNQIPELTPDVQVVSRPPFRFNRESYQQKLAIYKSSQVAFPPQLSAAPQAPKVHSSLRIREPVNPLRNPRRNTWGPALPKQIVGLRELSVEKSMEEKTIEGEISMFAERLLSVAAAADGSVDPTSPLPVLPALGTKEVSCSALASVTSAAAPSVPPTVTATCSSATSQEYVPTDEEIDNELLMLAGGWRVPSPANSDSDWDALDESTEQELVALTAAAEKVAAGMMEEEAGDLESKEVEMEESTMGDISRPYNASMVAGASPPKWPEWGWPFDGYCTQDQEMIDASPVTATNAPTTSEPTYPPFTFSGGPAFSFSFGGGAASVRAPIIEVDMSTGMSGVQETFIEEMEDAPPVEKHQHVSILPTSKLEWSDVPTPRSGSPLAPMETLTSSPSSPVTSVKGSDETNECLFDTAKMEVHQQSHRYEMAAAVAAVLEADIEAISLPVPGVLNPTLPASSFNSPTISGISDFGFLTRKTPDLIQAARNMAAIKATFEAGISRAAERREASRLKENLDSGTKPDESSDREKVLAENAIGPTTPTINWGGSHASGLAGPRPTVGPKSGLAYGPLQPNYFGDRLPDVGFGL